MAEVRLILTDDAWEEISRVLDVIKHKAGCPPQQSDRIVYRGGLILSQDRGSLA